MQGDVDCMAVHALGAHDGDGGSAFVIELQKGRGIGFSATGALYTYIQSLLRLNYRLCGKYQCLLIIWKLRERSLLAIALRLLLPEVNHFLPACFQIIPAQNGFGIAEA